MIIENIFDELQLIHTCNSMSVAAEKLGISQPALSMKVRKIEKELSCVLFDREQDMRLTQEGEVFFEYIKKRKQLDLELKSKLIDINNGGHGKLTIGAPNGFASSYVTACLSRFQKMYPDIQLCLIDDNVSKIEKLTLEGEIDVFFTTNQPGTSLFCKDILFEEDLLLCVPEKCKQDARFNDKFLTYEELAKTCMGGIGKEKAVSLSGFAEETFIVLPEELNMGKAIKEMLSDAGIENVKKIKTSQMTTAFAMAKKDMGIAFVTESYLRYVEHEVFPNILKIDSDKSKRKVYLAYLNDHYLSKAAKIFMNIIKGVDYI